MPGRLFAPDDAALLESVLKNRRDVRGNRFLSDPITDNDIDKLIDAALYSPSVGYSQPWEFVVVRDPAIKKSVQAIFAEENAKAAHEFSDQKQQQYARLKLEGISEAPVNLAVYYNPAQKPVLGQTSMKEMGLYSVVCAVQNIWLMARAMNIGVGWVSILDPVKVNQLLGMPTNRRMVAYLCVGHVTEFAETPELENLQWEKRKQKQRLVYRDAFQTPFYSTE
ncbi:MAG: 5,6-dimethylbenzimidazole synthase [Gammaproteobacteria bacterium]|nr:MAG: 5,6-dimethylbenzimidazole synthase [Gammaproteobacteria bacterium]